MIGTRSLDGGAQALGGDGWRVRPFLGDEAAERAAVRPGVLDEPGWLAAHVPGSVVDDLWRAGVVPDPYVELNSRAAEWAADRAWLYATTIAAPHLAHDERAFLRFDGLDFGGAVFLDGELLGRHDSMFAPVEWEISGRLSQDRATHRLLVTITSAPQSEPQLGRTSRVRVHKSRMTYGWDFCPRLVHQGIWRPVSLVVTGAARIVDAWARPRIDEVGHGLVELRVAIDGPAAGLRVEATLRDGDEEIARGTAESRGATEFELELDAGRPRRWWPNGSVEGSPVVHRLAVTLRDGDGRSVDVRTVPVGFRTFELAPNVGAPAGARPYTLVVNGRRMHANGWNWVPLDVCYGVPRPERLGHLLRLARDAGVNLLRVWGGGLIESEAFYDACDELGILVWQEFSLSSSGFESTPSDDPGYVAALTRDALSIVPLHRNHPSLAIWCGGNELEDETGPLDDVRSPALAALASVVRELDPDRAWLPTSPTGPTFANRLDTIAADPDGLHDVHGPWEHQGLGVQERLYDAGTSLLASEFGAEGMTNRRTLEALIRPEHRLPPTRANPVYRHLGDWWINEQLVQASFGSRLRALDDVRRASQWLQAEGLRYAVEANRRRWPRSSGTLPWQLNEPYPNAWCTSAIDHRGDPKPAYFAVAHAYEPVHVCASYATTAWGGTSEIRARVFGWSNAGARSGARIDARLVELDGAPATEERWTVDLPADGRAVAAGEIALPLGASDERPVLLDLTLSDADGAPGSTSRVPFSRTGDLAPYLDLPPTQVEVECADEGPERWRLEVRNDGGAAAIGLSVLDDRPIEAPGWAEPSDGWFHLLPGERRSMTVRWADVPATDRQLRIDGWNLEAADGLVVG
jgi:beta-mannosidase